MFSIAAAPAKQSVSETISVLGGRLSSATQLEDRRAAILGLRSFAKEYPASVASGALRSLIGSLSQDGEDVDTVKSVLETLLMLFSPNPDSPEASEEIALWLADEFTQRQENVALLLDFLETADFYSRLYSLQLLLAILSARTERTQECILAAHASVSRLVAVLDDRREAVRNEAITLLTFLTTNSPEIQKLAAFDVFDRVFKIIASEGSFTQGGRVVEDCLILLANLLRLNSMNQALFREEGCLPKLSKLLESTYKAEADDEAEIAGWAVAQQNRNIYALLAVIRLFLVPGAVGTAQNQAAFWQHGILYHALQLAFSHEAETQIKAEALITCADIIRGNRPLQENFAQLQVLSPIPAEPQPDQKNKANGIHRVYVIDGLLDATLTIHASSAFDMRMAACECLKAYFFDHPDVRLHFLRRAIEGHNMGADETGNVLTTLLRSPSETSLIDPYRHWFAAVIMFHLICENPTAKALAMAVHEGDEAAGEEVVTAIQTITAHLLTSLRKGDDDRIVIGYLMLLSCWLFEDLDGVNDFLGEGSSVMQGLVQEVVKPSDDRPIAQGLCAMLLGVVYEFSTKDSPVPRATLQPILVSQMGRDRYIEKLKRLRSHHLLRDFEVLPQKMDLSSGQKLPDVFFDAGFVEFFKDNYNRLVRAIDRDPGMEISVLANGVQKGISREMVDSLRAQLDERDRALQDAQGELAAFTKQASSEQNNHKQALASAAAELQREQSSHKQALASKDAELQRIKSVNESLQKHHEEEDKALKRRFEEEMNKLRNEHRMEKDALTKQAEHARRTAESEASRVQRRAEAELADLRATNSRLEVDLMKANKSKTQELQAAKDAASAKFAEQVARSIEADERAQELEGKLAAMAKKVADLEKTLKTNEGSLEQANDKCRDLEDKLAAMKKEVDKAKEELEEKVAEKQATQSELDDLLMVFGDLEEKAAGYKSRLKGLGETIEDSDEDGDGEEDDDEEEEEDDEKS